MRKDREKFTGGFPVRFGENLIFGKQRKQQEKARVGILFHLSTTPPIKYEFHGIFYLNFILQYHFLCINHT